MAIQQAAMEQKLDGNAVSERVRHIQSPAQQLINPTPSFAEPAAWGQASHFFP